MGALRGLRSSRRRKALGALALGALAIWGIAAAVWTRSHRPVQTGDGNDWIIDGVSLGIEREGAKAAFTDAPFGHWSNKTGCGGLAYEWDREPVDGPTKTHVVSALLEFERGVLVAYRVKLDRRTTHHRIEVLPEAVREDRATFAGETVTLLSRTCPKHQAEVDQVILLQQALHL